MSREALGTWNSVRRGAGATGGEGSGHALEDAAVVLIAPDDELGHQAEAFHHLLLVGLLLGRSRLRHADRVELANEVLQHLERVLLLGRLGGAYVVLDPSERHRAARPSGRATARTAPGRGSYAGSASVALACGESRPRVCSTLCAPALRRWLWRSDGDGRACPATPTNVAELRPRAGATEKASNHLHAPRMEACRHGGRVALQSSDPR